jgi:hypothetical protein
MVNFFVHLCALNLHALDGHSSWRVCGDIATLPSTRGNRDPYASAVSGRMEHDEFRHARTMLG